MGEVLERVTIKPAPGFVIYEPTGVRLSDEGKEVNLDTFWFRRLEQGDVVLVEPKVDSSSAAETKRAAKAAKKETGGTEQ